MNFLAQKRSKIFIQHTDQQQPVPGVFDDFHYKEIARLTGAGGFCINFKEKKSYLDPQALKILETPEEFVPSLRTAMRFFPEDQREKAAELFTDCSDGKAFSTTIKMVTFLNKNIWVKAKGRPIYDNFENIIGVQGIFQDINTEKLKEIELRRSLKIIESQNSRLNNFANIVTHSVRSHATNLQLTLELIKQSECEKDKAELCDNLNDISDSLNTTVQHLVELVAIQAKVKEDRELLTFEEVLDRIKSKISLMLLETNTEIYTDFSEVPSIEYIPSYLENIMYNLVSNAVKFRSEDRNPVIEIFTIKEEDGNKLIVKDNGLGIDLDKYGGKIFNIYQTFHNVEDSNGVGLFLTKNQVEALQGTISVKSKVGEGSTFTIRF